MSISYWYVRRTATKIEYYKIVASQNVALFPMERLVGEDYLWYDPVANNDLNHVFKTFFIL